jgi:hypothetical protein
VTDQQDPLRWSEADSDAGPELRELFRSAAFDVPSDAQLQALRARLPNPPAGPPPATGGKSGLLGSGGRALAVTAAIGGLAALVAVVGLRSSERPAETTAPPMASSSSRLLEPVPASSPSPNVGPTAPSEPTAAAPAPSASSARTKMPNEAALLERARRALSSNPALALELTRRHQAEFPRGVLRQEREVIAIEALRRLGKADQARERGSDFRREFPDSPHGRAVDRGLVP